LPGWQRDERRKQAAEGSLGSPEKRTKDENENEDEDEHEDEHDRDMALNTYGDKSRGYYRVSLRDEGKTRRFVLCACKIQRPNLTSSLATPIE
jgi:hypothetical protein